MMNKKKNSNVAAAKNPSAIEVYRNCVHIDFGEFSVWGKIKLSCAC